MPNTGTERKVVKVYLPLYQKEEWREHAEELGMNQSEFVKSMVQAGRRGFDLTEKSDESVSEDETPRVDALEDEVLDVLDDDYSSWDELVGSIAGNMEDRLETILQRLQRENRIEYNGRRGGYGIINTDDN